MLPPGERAQHGERLRIILRLAENRAIAGDRRIRGNEQRIGKIGLHRLRLGAGKAHHQLRRGLARKRRFIDIRLGSREIKTEHLQQQRPPGRGRSKDNLHERFQK